MKLFFHVEFALLIILPFYIMFFLEKDGENYVCILSTDEVSVSKEQGTFDSVEFQGIIFKKKFLIEFWMYLDNFVCSNRMYDSVNNFFYTKW